jgi:glycosyltransferase involved in cell wall biosynthesis
MKNPGPVLHIQTNDEWGGGENQVLHLLIALRAQRVPVVLWAPPGAPLLARAIDEGLPAHPIPRGLFARRAAVRALGPVLLHAHDSKGLDLALALKRAARVPLIYSRRIASPVRPGYFSQRKYHPSRIDAVLAISETVRDVMQRSSRYPADRIYLAPTGIDVDALARVEPDPAWRARAGGRFLAGGLGRLAPKKNWDFLLRVAARLREEEPALRWIVAGDGPERERLLALARALNVDDLVQFVGFQLDGARLLKSLDLLFFPSQREGASVTIREAMALGVPVAAVDAPGSMESLGGHGWALRDGDVDGAAAAVREILHQPDKREAVVAAARASARERFDFTRTAADTLAAYRRLVPL